MPRRVSGDAFQDGMQKIRELTGKALRTEWRKPYDAGSNGAPKSDTQPDGSNVHTRSESRGDERAGRGESDRRSADASRPDVTSLGSKQTEETPRQYQKP